VERGSHIPNIYVVQYILYREYILYRDTLTARCEGHGMYENTFHIEILSQREYILYRDTCESISSVRVSL